MSLNSKQKSLCQMATTTLPKKDKEKGNSKKMKKAHLGLVP